MSARPLLAVDGDSLAHRAFHALPSSIKDGASHCVAHNRKVFGFAFLCKIMLELGLPIRD